MARPTQATQDSRQGKQSVTYRLPAEIRRILRMEAARRGVSQSWLIEIAIRKMLKLAA